MWLERCGGGAGGSSGGGGGAGANAGATAGAGAGATVVLLLGVNVVESVAAMIAVPVGASSEQYCLEWLRRSVKVSVSEECDVARRDGDGERLVSLRAMHEQDVQPCFVQQRSQLRSR